MQPSKNAISSRFFFGLGSEKIEVQLISGLQNKTGGFDHKVMLEPLTGNDEESIFHYLCGLLDKKKQLLVISLVFVICE